MKPTKIKWHRLARLVALALALICVPPAVLMTIQGDHVAANNAMSLPLGWCAMLWLVGVPVSEGDK